MTSLASAVMVNELLALSTQHVLAMADKALERKNFDRDVVNLERNAFAMRIGFPNGNRNATPGQFTLAVQSTSEQSERGDCSMTLPASKEGMSAAEPASDNLDAD